MKQRKEIVDKEQRAMDESEGEPNSRAVVRLKTVKKRQRRITTRRQTRLGVERMR